MRLSQTNGEGAPVSARKFWDEVEKTKPNAWCEQCDYPDGACCADCKVDHAKELINAERFA